MDADGQGGEQTRAHKMMIRAAVVVEAGGGPFRIGQCGGGRFRRRRRRVVERPGFRFGVGFMGVHSRRDQIVDQADDQHAAEERGGVEPGTPVVAVVQGEGSQAFGKDLHEGYIEHDPGREARGRGEKSVIRPPGREGDDAPHPRGHAGKYGQTHCHPKFSHPLFLSI